MAKKFDLCIVIPAYNEELVIEESLKALKGVIPARHIYVVSDGSSDKTAVMARKHTENVLNLRKNRGKAEALAALMRKFALKERYKYVLFSDADSRLVPNFLKEIKKFIPDKPACIVGTVASDRHGLISAYRTYDYWICNNIFKKAQSIAQVITVAPGCASLYSSEVLDQLEFSRRTLTEDFDLTLQIHLKKLGSVVMASKARVITQDPQRLRDYWNQIVRWYTGFWQNMFLHKMYLPRHRVALELWLLVVDSLLWFGMLAFGAFHPLYFIKLLFYTYLLVVGVGTIVLMIEKAWWGIKYVPFFIIFQLINCAGYFYSFARAIIGAGKDLSWKKVQRYEIVTAK